MQSNQHLDQKQQCKNCLSLYRSLYQSKKDNFELTRKLRDLEGEVSLREGAIKFLEDKLERSYKLSEEYNKMLDNLRDEVLRLEKEVALKENKDA